jgi:Flp pilus assembly protein protease CpaA
MIDIMLFFIPCIAILGIITSYEDIKEGKIRNKYLIWSLIYGLIFYFAWIIFLKLTSQGINWLYFVKTLINAIVMLVFGFVLWQNGFWTSGDAKLFSVLSFILPISIYKYGYIPYVSSIILLINTFMPLAVFYIIKIIAKTQRKQKIYILKKIFKSKDSINYILLMFVMLWIPLLLSRAFQIKISQVEVIGLGIALSLLLEKVCKKEAFSLLIMVSILRLLLDKSVYSLYFINGLIISVVCFFVAQTAIKDLGYIIFSESIAIGKLKKGMILAERIYQKNKRFFKDLYFKKNRSSKYAYWKCTGDGLNDEDIEKINGLASKKMLSFNSIKIKHTIPFAPFLFLGVLITIIAQGNIFVTVQKINEFLSDYAYISLDYLSIIAVVCAITLIIKIYSSKDKRLNIS